MLTKEHTEELWYNETVCGWQYYAHSRGMNTLPKELMTATRVMQGSTNELSILVSGKQKCKQKKATT